MEAASTPRGPGRPFPKGKSANPAGRPRGTRNRITKLAESLLDTDAAEIVGVIVQAAKRGDLVACQALLKHILPPARERRLPTLQLPDTGTAQGLSEAAGTVVAAVGEGHITPGEGAALVGLLESRRRILETAELEARILRLEAKGTR